LGIDAVEEFLRVGVAAGDAFAHVADGGVGVAGEGEIVAGGGVVGADGLGGEQERGVGEERVPVGVGGGVGGVVGG
jgi:hypothetical protein